MGKGEPWRRDEVQSPCIKICQIHPAERICVGCFRTTQEIGMWSLMSDEERREVLDALPERASRVSRGEPEADVAATAAREGLRLVSEIT